MHVCHFNTYLNGTPLYYNLYRELRDQGVGQTVFVPLPKGSHWCWDGTITGIECQTAAYLTPLDRILFHRKIKKGVDAFAPFMNSVSGKSCILHAHSLFSDGALAYEFSRRLGLVYTVAVRSTDLNTFWKCMPHLRPWARRILRGARRIIFLSEAYRKRGRKMFGHEWEAIAPRTEIIPNGIHAYWHTPPVNRNSTPHSEVRILYVGQFIKRKRLKDIMSAAESLLSQGLDVKVRFVGASLDSLSSIAISDQKSWLEVCRFTKSREELVSHFAWADVFAMPSRGETFGLVYAEALSQGVPVIYTKDEGFDGWCPDETCGLSVRCGDIPAIARAVIHLKKSARFATCRSYIKNFKWDTIAARYLTIYESLITS